jgi:Ca2+-binding RTX toxin-like protein
MNKESCVSEFDINPLPCRKTPMSAPVVWSEPSYEFLAGSAALPDGSLIAVWDSTQGVYRQMMNADGTPRGGPLRIDGTNDYNQQDANVAVLEDGRIVVTWTDARVTGNHEIKARILKADGSPESDVFSVNLARTNGDQDQPTISALKGGGFVIGYRDSSGTTPDTMVQAFDRNGTRVGDEFAASAVADGREQYPEVVGLENGNYVFLYSAAGIVRGVIRTPDGEVAEGTKPFIVPNGGLGSGQHDFSAALLSDGRFVVVWKSEGISGGDTDGWGVYAQVFEQDGTRSGDQILVNTTVEDDQVNPMVTALQDGGFAVAFEHRSTTQDGKVRLRSFTKDGDSFDPDSDDFLVSSQFTDRQILLDLSSTKDGRIIISWGDVSSTGRQDASAIFDPRKEAQRWTGTSANEQFGGTVFSDTLNGGAGDDMLLGGPGNEYDRLIGGAGADTLNGGAGYDTASYETAAAGVRLDISGKVSNTGDAAGDRLISIEGIGGSAHNDTLIGSSGRDDLYGDAGDDTLEGGDGDFYLIGEKGDDVLYAGAGNDMLYGHTQEQGQKTEGWDRVSYQRAGAIVLDFRHGKAHGGAAEGDVFHDINAYVGSFDADIMLGADGGDQFYGDGGDDRLVGGGGDDYLFGQTDDDTLEGGAGNDILDGGSGVNKAIYVGARGEYDITHHADGTVTVRDLDGSEGTDTLTGVRQLQFSGGVTEVFNVAPTGLMLSDASVEESAPNRAVVGTLSATDADGDTLTYSLMPGSSSAFAIDPDSNSLVVTGPLDFETKPHHQLTIQAKDAYGAVTSLAVTVTVTNAIETTPFYHPRHAAGGCAHGRERQRHDLWRLRQRSAHRPGGQGRVCVRHQAQQAQQRG